MSDKRVINLIEGSIFTSLMKLALPIIATSFVQTAYSLVDMIWVGRIGSGAVAAVGTAGFFSWLANAFIVIPKIGAEVGVAQAIGKNDRKEAKDYVRHSIQLIVVMSLIYAAGLILFSKPLISFYHLGAAIEQQASMYLIIIALGMVFFALNPIFTGIFTGAGDSTTPFRINVLGLILNIILDPLLIFGFGPIPRLEVAGAAIATIIAQFVVTMAFIFEAKKRPELFSGLKLRQKPNFALVKRITSMGFPVGLQSGMFTLIAMTIARIIANWGPLPIAVQNVGSQIESISWMTAGGFQSAMAAFVGQNYGAKRGERVYHGYFVGVSIVSVIGLFASILLIFAAEPIFSIFIPESEAIRLGTSYLQILGLCQIFMCIEILTAGSFIGLGKTTPPSIVSIGCNLLRIPVALVLSSTHLGLDGIWWAISSTCILKGVLLGAWHLAYLRTNPEMLALRAEAA